MVHEVTSVHATLIFWTQVMRERLVQWVHWLAGRVGELVSEWVQRINFMSQNILWTRRPKIVLSTDSKENKLPLLLDNMILLFFDTNSCLHFQGSASQRIFSIRWDQQYGRELTFELHWHSHK